MPKPFPAEFRRDFVAVTRKHEAPIAQIARDFGIPQATLHSWLKKADIEDGARPGVSAAEAAELRDAKKRGLTRTSGRPVHDDLVKRDFTATAPNQTKPTVAHRHHRVQRG